jgi:hypothetical protein
MIGTMMWNSTMSPEVLYAFPLSTRTRELIQGSYGRGEETRLEGLQSSSRNNSYVHHHGHTDRCADE